MTYSNYRTEDLNKEVLIQDEDFLIDASTFLKERANYDFDTKTDQEAIYNQFMEHFRRQNVNEYTATKDLFHAQNTTDEGRERFSNLMGVYDRMDSDFGWRAAGDYLEGVALAPSTYAGIFSFGAAKAGAVAANQGIKLGIREVLKRAARERLKDKGMALTAKNIAKEQAKKAPTLGQKALQYKQGFMTGGYKTALGSMAVDAPIAGYTVFQQERTRKQLGLTEDISLANVGMATALGAVASGSVGAIIGTSKTLSANMAEQIRNVAIAKETASIEAVHKGITSNTFKNAKTSGTAKKVAKTLKMSLEESVPELKKTGKELKDAGISGDVEFGQIGYGPSLDQKLHENIASAVALILHKIKPIKTTREVLNKKTGKMETKVVEERIASRLSRGLINGEINDVQLFKILKEHDLSMKQLAGLMVEEYSQAGAMLGRAGRIAQKEKKELLAELTDLDQKIISLSDVITPAKQIIKESGVLGQGAKALAVMRAWGGLKAIDKASIGLMTIQTATTARNTTNGYMRNISYALDNLGEGFATLLKGGAYKGAGLVGITNKQIADEATRAVNMGMAQMRTGGQSLLGKDLWLGTKSWETEALELLFRDKRFLKSDLAKQLFREMGDIGELTGEEGGLLWLARKANYLNTLSDNMFKRATFSKEIDKYLFASGQRGGLKGFFEDAYLDPINASSKTGMFTKIDDKAIGEAMRVALEQTYQTGKFQGREGAFNVAADAFIKLVQMTPFVGTAAAPFPRYLVNQLIFAYEHMPILGIVNMGGILNKEAGAKGARGIPILPQTRLALDAKTFGSQVSGLATLAAFYGIRHHFGDESSGPYEINNPFGTGRLNLTATLGPYMAFAFAADALYRMTGPNRKRKWMPQLHNNDKIAVDVPTPTRDFVKALTGGQGRAGTGLYITDAIVDFSLNASERGLMNNPDFEEGLAKYLGNLFNRATVPMGMLKDIAGTILDPNYRVLKDNTSTDFMEYWFKQATRSFPDKYEPDEGDVPVFNPTTNEKPIHKINPFLKMITGLVEEGDKNPVKFELDRLRFDYREIVPRKIKGDAPASNIAKGWMGIFSDTQITGYILSDDYKNIPSDRLKRFYLKRLINAKRDQARAKTLALLDTDTIAERHQKFKNIWNSLPMDKKGNIEWYFKNEPTLGNGTSLYDIKFPDGTMGDYETAIFEYERIFGDTDEDLVKVKDDSERVFGKEFRSKFLP